MLEREDRFNLDRHRGKEYELFIALVKESERFYFKFNKGESLEAVSAELNRLVREQTITRQAADKILSKAKELLETDDKTKD